MNMTDIFLLLLFSPLILATIAFIVFRFLAINYGRRILAIAGFIWASLLVYWLSLEGCVPPPQGEGDDGCRFVSFLWPLITISKGATLLLSMLGLIYWFYKIRNSKAEKDCL